MNSTLMPWHALPGKYCGIQRIGDGCFWPKVPSSSLTAVRQQTGQQ